MQIWKQFRGQPSMRESGWTHSLIEANLATSGIVVSFLVYSNVPRTRHVHQITACALFELLMSAYFEDINSDNSADDSVSYDDLID